MNSWTQNSAQESRVPPPGSFMKWQERISLTLKLNAFTAQRQKLHHPVSEDCFWKARGGSRDFMETQLGTGEAGLSCCCSDLNPNTDIFTLNNQLNVVLTV